MYLWNVYIYIFLFQRVFSTISGGCCDDPLRQCFHGYGACVHFVLLPPLVEINGCRTERTPPLPPSLSSFSRHYSYKFAEVMSADAFAAFEEVGLDDDEAVSRIGKRFKDTVLSMGGSRDASQVFRCFRGRDPTRDALLRHCRLGSNAASVA